MSSKHSHNQRLHPGTQSSSTSRFPPTTRLHASRFPSGRYTKAIVPAIAPAPQPTKVYRCNCTQLCKDPNGVIVSRRTWYRHAEHRDSDEAERHRREREPPPRASVEPANQAETHSTHSPESMLPGSESNKRRRLEDVSFPSLLVDALMCF